MPNGIARPGGIVGAPPRPHVVLAKAQAPLPADPDGARVTPRDDGGVLVLALAGQWRLSALTDPGRMLVNHVDGARPLRVEDGGLTDWDSSILLAIDRLCRRCGDLGVAIDLDPLPPGLRRLLRLARGSERRPPEGGGRLPEGRRGAVAALSFLGELVLALGALAVGRGRMRAVDFARAVEDSGAAALPIVGLVSLLVGLTFAFVGAVQLRRFGATIYVADLIGLAATRELAAVMTAVVAAGRTGAAFAAQLAAMQADEEIDALVALGLAPAQFLALPRVLGLALMMPLLFVYSCALCLAGGWLVGVGVLGISGAGYVAETRAALELSDFAIGLAKSVAFGLAVAYAGCLRGLEAGRSAAAVGRAATSAVVTSIVLVIVIDAAFAVLTDAVGL
jgi:phospholipid/cholesterol/gamma-HCH transport system permease protein